MEFRIRKTEYEQHNFDATSFEIDVVPILEDARNENKSGKYRLADGADFLLVYATKKSGAE